MHATQQWVPLHLHWDHLVQQHYLRLEGGVYFLEHRMEELAKRLGRIRGQVGFPLEIRRVLVPERGLIGGVCEEVKRGF